MSDFMTLAKARYSVRSFSSKAIEPEKLAVLREAALIAPTAKNGQCFRMYIARSAEAMEKLNTLSPCMYGAPACLIFVKRTDEEFHNGYEPEFSSGVEDASIVACHVMLAAADIGLGSCWVNRFPPMATARAFGLPAEEVPVLLLPIGYAAPDGLPAERHTLSRPADELIREL